MESKKLLRVLFIHTLSIVLGLGSAIVPVSVQIASADGEDDGRSRSLSPEDRAECLALAKRGSKSIDELSDQELEKYRDCLSRIRKENAGNSDSNSDETRCRTDQAEVTKMSRSFTQACGKSPAKCNKWAKSCLGSESSSCIPEKIQEAYLANKEIKELEEKSLELQEQLTEQESVGKEVQTEIDAAERAYASAKDNLDKAEKQAREDITEKATQAAAQLKSQIANAEAGIRSKNQERQLQQSAFNYSRQVDCKKQSDAEVETLAAKLKVKKCKTASQCIGTSGKYRQRLLDFGAQSMKECQFRVATKEREVSIKLDAEIATFQQAITDARTQLNQLSPDAQRAAERALAEFTTQRKTAHNEYLNQIRPLSAKLETATKKYGILQQKAQKLGQQIAAQKEILDQIKESNSLASEDLESGDISGSDVESREYSGTGDKSEYGDKFTTALGDFADALNTAKNTCCGSSDTPVDQGACNSVNQSLSALGIEDNVSPLPRETASAPEIGEEAEPAPAPTRPAAPRPAVAPRTAPPAPTPATR